MKDDRELIVQISDTTRPFNVSLALILEDIGNLLIEKNRKYGDSALNPIRIFSKAAPQEQIKVRIDDKISRLVRGDAIHEDEDVVMDLIGYLVILQMCQTYVPESNILEGKNK